MDSGWDELEAKNPGSANGHRRSSTVDTVNVLADQLESLNMNW